MSLLAIRFPEFGEDGQNADEDDGQNHLFKVGSDEGEFAQRVAEHGEKEYPADAAKDVEGEEAAIVHAGDAGDERSEGADDGNEARVDDGLAAVALIELMRARQVFLLEET